jgi:hypothetical protein
MIRVSALLASATIAFVAACRGSVEPVELGSITAHDGGADAKASGGGLDAQATSGDGGWCPPPDAALVSVRENGSDPRCPPAVPSGAIGIADPGPSCCPNSPICSYEPGGALAAICVLPENVWIYCSDAFGDCEHLIPAHAGQLCCQFGECHIDAGLLNPCSCSDHHIVCKEPRG